MVLAIPYFLTREGEAACAFVAYMPRPTVKLTGKGAFRCSPALLRDGQRVQRRDHAVFFGASGIQKMERPDWPSLTLDSV
jgi:hypothetical protein